MLKQKEFILNTSDDFKQIESVKDRVQEIHANGTFFQLSLKTLELMRRFNNLYIKVFEQDDDSSSTFNQLLVNSHTLETELVREHS